MQQLATNSQNPTNDRALPYRMRNNAPSRQQPQQGRVQAAEPPVRKIFNCIVDDSAFLAGVKKSTRDGIRKWINNGSMRLFVPLYTLEQIDRLKRAGGKTSADATEALLWLDDVTSVPEVQAAGLVQLQGGDEIYPTWGEVEQFLLPETLLSMTEDVYDDSANEDLGESFHSQDSIDKFSETSTGKTPDSPRSISSNGPAISNGTTQKEESPRKSNGNVKSRNSMTRNSRESIKKEQQSNKSVVPAHMQPFFNHLIWRIHHEQNPDISAESFILLTNDPKKQAIAQRFSVRAKRLEQMRDIIGREEREFRNRQAWIKREEQEEKDKSEEEDEVVFKSRGSASRPKSGQQQVFDPNDFGRARHIASPAAPAAAAAATPTAPTAPTTPTAPTAPRGGRGGRGGFRGGRGGAPTPAPSTPRGGGAPRAAEATPNGPIDPDSFARPAPGGRTLRGGRRKLWEPA